MKKTNDRPKKNEPNKEIGKVNAKPKEVKIYERFFETSAYSLEEAQKTALNYFSINELSILEHEVVSKGKKKFILFGSQLTNYKFKVQPIYRKILLPFLIKVIRKMGLKIYINVTFRNPNVSVVFSGEDAGLLVKNKFELHNALKDISLTYLRNKISMSSNTKITFKTDADGSGKTRGRSDRKENGRSNDRRPRQNNSKSEVELQKMADVIKQEVLEKNSAVLMKSLNPAERRLVHQYIEADTKFKSSSVGDGRFKQIEISLID